MKVIDLTHTISDADVLVDPILDENLTRHKAFNLKTRYCEY